MNRQAHVHRISTASPDDTAGLEAMFASGSIEPGNIVAILGKTEGNGCVNDFTRGFASRALIDCLANHASTEVAENVCIVMSGGTEGAMAPHLVVFEARATNEAEIRGALAIGTSRTPVLPWHDLGRVGQVELVAAGVRMAMQQAGITRPQDVHFVQVKCPLLTKDRMAMATDPLVTGDTLKSMAFSRGASALGVAVALGEIDPAAVSDSTICRDWTRFSARASVSAGVELDYHEILVLGHGTGWSGPLRIDHAVMRDAIDIAPVQAAMQRLGIPDNAKFVALLAKAEASSTGKLRGHRHTMLDDSDISATRHARGFVAGVLASLVGHAEIYVSGGAEHQGPDGGGPVAIIALQNSILVGSGSHE